MGQKQVNKNLAIGIPGKLAIDPLRCKYRTYKCGDLKIVPGMFIQLDPSTGLTKPAMKYPSASVNSANVDKVYVGVTIHEEYFNDTGNNSNRIPYGNVVRVLYDGDIYMRFTTACVAGKYIHLKKADGEIVFDDSQTKADHIFTGARVYQGASANEISIVSIKFY